MVEASIISGRAPVWQKRMLSAHLLVAVLLASSHRVSGQTLEFEVDSLQSILSLVPAEFSGSTVVSGTRLFSTVGVVQQFNGSLSTSLSGSLFGTLNGNVLTLDSQSFVVATESTTAPFEPPSSLTGSPGGLDNFGGLAVRSNGTTTTVDSTLAIRNIKASIAGGDLTIGETPENLAVSVTDGLIDLVDPPFGNEGPFYYYYEVSDLIDPEPIESNSTQTTTGSFAGTIRFPFSLVYPFSGGGSVELEGVVVAKRVGLPPVLGDFDGNRVVDSDDLVKWQGDFGLNANSDADGDGDSDGADFLIWQREVYSSPAELISSPVPEPSGALLVALSLIGFAMRKLS